MTVQHVALSLSLVLITLDLCQAAEDRHVCEVCVWLQEHGLLITTPQPKLLLGWADDGKDPCEHAHLLPD